MRNKQTTNKQRMNNGGMSALILAQIPIPTHSLIQLISFPFNFQFNQKKQMRPLK